MRGKESIKEEDEEARAQPLVPSTHFTPDLNAHGTAAPASLGEERWPWVLLSFLLAAPLSFAPRLTALKYTASLSVGIVLSLAVVALLYVGGAWDPCESPAAAAEEEEGTCMYVWDGRADGWTEGRVLCGGDGMVERAGADGSRTLNTNTLV